MYYQFSKIDYMIGIFVLAFTITAIIGVSFNDNNKIADCIPTNISISTGTCCQRYDEVCEECVGNTPYCSELIELETEGKCCYDSTCSYRHCYYSGGKQHCYTDYHYTQKAKVKCTKCSDAAINYDVFDDILIAQVIVFDKCSGEKCAENLTEKHEIGTNRTCWYKKNDETKIIFNNHYKEKTGDCIIATGVFAGIIVALVGFKLYRRYYGDKYNTLY